MLENDLQIELQYHSSPVFYVTSIISTDLAILLQLLIVLRNQINKILTGNYDVLY